MLGVRGGKMFQGLSACEMSISPEFIPAFVPLSDTCPGHSENRLVGPYGVQEDRIDLHTVHVESHLMDPDLDVSMMPSLDGPGLMTMTAPLEPPPPPPPPPPLPQ